MVAPEPAGPENPWRGVSLGGWLLLEPGPASPLFDDHPCLETKETMRCEWTLMQALRKKLGKEGAADVIRHHRENHITRRDFEQIRARGLNAVRLPFGYWIVVGPLGRDPYVGPGLEHIDRALDWAEECGLQVMLDLHGCPGGESGEAPCGHRQRPHGKWKWRQWRRKESLEALAVLAKRYKSRACVTGIAVCNEPSESIPSSVLIEYYDQSVDLIRNAGMPSRRVAVVLPVFQREEDEFVKEWTARTRGKHKNVCFDIHCYHCFENKFNGKTLAEHLRHVQENAKWLRTHPVVVGEWSLALGCAAWSTCGEMDDRAVYKIFGNLQREAYNNASHGHFFWNWTERPDCLEWNFQRALQDGLVAGKPRRLPPGDFIGEDPLEEELHPSPKDPDVRFGEKVFLRTFYGRYIDVEKGTVSARWPDKGDWQALTFVPAASSSDSDMRKAVKRGQVVRLKTHAGSFLAVSPDPEGRVCARRGAAPARTEFVVDFAHGSVLKHRGHVSLKSAFRGCLLDADDEQEGLFCRWDDPGDWQLFAVEKSAEEKMPEKKSKVGKESTAHCGVGALKNGIRTPPAGVPSAKRTKLQ